MTVLLICAVATLAGANNSLFPSVLSALSEDASLRISDLSHISGAQVAIANFAAPFFGVLADRNTLRRKSILLIACAGLSLLTLVIAFVDFWELTIALLPLANAALMPIADSIIADLTAASHRGRVIGRVRSAFTVGGMLSAMLTSHMGREDYFGLPGWRFAYLVLSAVAAATCLLLAAFFQEPPRPDIDGLRSVIEEVADLVKFFRVPTFSIMIVDGVFYSLPWSVLNHIVLFFRQCGISSSTTSFLNQSLLGGQAIGGICGGCLADWLVARIGLRGRPLNAQIGVCASIAILVTTFYGIAPGRGSILLYFLLLALFGASTMWVESGTDFPVIAEVMPVGSRARAMAVKSSLQMSLSYLIGSNVFLFIAKSLYDFDFDKLEDVESVESAKTFGMSIVVTSCIGWGFDLVIYTVLHWSYPRDVSRLKLRSSQSSLELCLGGPSVGTASQYDVAVSSSESSEEDEEADSSLARGGSSGSEGPSSLTSEEAVGRYKGWGMDGQALHDEVDPHSWCVTKQDLRFFRSEVKAELRAGRICRHGRDEFDPKDERVGPSMYTVVDQYIKPLTARAGNMSWALLCNPQGLSCDLFITHCWAEGIFEFLDKVLHSWPEGKHHAYICVFANPQNLDICHLLREPRSSPFAKALDSSTHMMVVPNGRCGIYTRAWCAYEAWLAYRAGKIIFTATRRPSLMRRVLESSVLLLLPVAGGAGGYYLMDAMSPLAHSPSGSILQLLSSFMLLAQTAIFSFWQQRSLQSEAKRLCREYTVIAEADATNPLDKKRILDDIGDDTDAVDRSIGLLLQHGMSTPMLRNLSDRGVMMKSALDPNRFPGTGLAFLFITGRLTSIPLALAISICWYRSEMDSRAVIRGAVNNVARLLALATLLASVTIGLFATAERASTRSVLGMESASVASMAITDTLLCLVLGTAIVGLERVAALPLVGRPLSWVLRPGAFRSCFQCPCCPSCLVAST